MKGQTSARTVNYGDRLVHRATCISVPSLSRKDFLSSLFKELDTRQIRYCVLHSWEELPDKLSSDLDIAVHPKDARKLSFVFRFLREKGYKPVQVFSYFVSAHYFVFCWSEGPVVNYVAVDVILEHRRSGLIAPSGEQLVSGRRRKGTFWIPAPESEFTYLLAKKTWKAAVPARQARRLRALVEQLGRPTAEKLASQLFLGKLGARVVAACASERIDALIGQIRTQMWKTSLVRNPLRLTAYLLSDAVRRVRRWFQPTGLLVVIMGPDGAGKSTLIEHLVPAVGPAFRRHRIFHWRPMLLWRRKATGDTTQPHRHPAYASWWSIARLFAHLLDYWLGYWLLIRPLLARSGLVVFDRYFHDLLADPKRYRFGGPSWLVRSVAWLVPKPDLLFILDAPVLVIHSRKQEVSPDDVSQQIQIYRQFASSFYPGRVIDSAAPPDRVTAEATHAIVQYLANRFRQQHCCWADPG